MHLMTILRNSLELRRIVSILSIPPFPFNQECLFAEIFSCTICIISTVDLILAFYQQFPFKYSYIHIIQLIIRVLFLMKDIKLTSLMMNYEAIIKNNHRLSLQLLQINFASKFIKHKENCTSNSKYIVQFINVS